MGIVVFGELGFETPLQHFTCAIPFVDRFERQVLIHSTVIQLGQKPLKTVPIADQKLSQTKTALVAVTLWKEDFTEEWNQVSSNPIGFLKQQCVNDGIISIWGKSFRAGRRPTTPSQCSSIQMHLSIPEDRLQAFLTKSGHNSLWATPKTSNGQLSSEWRLIWLPHGTEKQQARFGTSKESTGHSGQL